MAEKKDNGLLARLLAGLLGPGVGQQQEPNFAPAQPFTGLHNEPYGAPMQLPPFEQPGTASADLMPWRGLPQQPQTMAAMPQAQPQPMPQQMPQQPMPQGGAPWLALGNQQRTAAFDPLKDLNDPGNIHAVDEFGRAIPRGKLGPV